MNDHHSLYKRTSDSDNAFVKLYIKYKEAVHIVGFVILVAFTLGGNWTKWQAQAAMIDTHEMRISKLEYNNGQILQNLEDIKFYFKIPERHQ